MAQIAVIGLGRFGHHLARAASEEGHEVLALSIRADDVDEVKDFAHRAVVVDATERDKLEALGVEAVDVAVVSVGQRIDASALIVLHLREMGVAHIVAKAGTAEHGRLLERIGAHEIVYPERDMAQRLARRLGRRNLLDFVPLGPEQAIEKVQLPASWIGRTLAEIGVRAEFGVAVVATLVGPNREVRLPPDPAAPLESGTFLIVVGAVADLERFRAALDVSALE